MSLHQHTNKHASKVLSVLKVLLMALLYFLAGKMSLNIVSENHIITIVIFAAEGFALAGVLLFGKIVLPGIFLGQFFLALSEGIAPLSSVGISIVNTFEGFIAWKIFNYFHFDRDIRHPNALFLLFIIIALILQPFSALFSTSILYLSSVVSSNEFLTSLFSWWFGNTLGQMLWTPMLILLYMNRQKIFFPELLLYVILFFLISWVTFIILPLSNLSIAIVLTLPISIYIAIRKSLLYASIMIVILSMVSIYATYRHIGVFATMPMLDNIINLNFYILVHILIVLGLGVLYREIEETKEKLSNLNRSLEKEVAQQVEQLNRQNIIMAQQARLASMGEMLGMIAHQWRQPLNSINSNIAVIQKIIQKTIPENSFLNQKLSNVTKQTKFMSETIEDFSKFFHPDKDTLHFNPCNTVKRALKLIELETMRISIQLNCPQKLTLHSFENEYLQVVLSILHNAIENFHAQNIESPTIILNLHQTNHNIILNIQDNGGGIQTTSLSSIFDPYFTTNHSGKNSGLGLYMAKLLVEESMRGKLSVINQNGGACFSISIPKRREEI
jgi:signal transduction histidine kinase